MDGCGMIRIQNVFSYTTWEAILYLLSAICDLYNTVLAENEPQHNAVGDSEKFLTLGLYRSYLNILCFKTDALLQG